MTDEETIRFQGPLEKQCKLKTWSWKKYWFVLFNEQLCYYKEQDSGGGRRSSSNELGEIDLNNARTIKEMKNFNRGFPFEIVTKSRSYILSADNAELRGQWVRSLQQAMCRRRSSTLRSLRDSCNSIDGGYTDIKTTALGAGQNIDKSRTFPAALPSNVSNGVTTGRQANSISVESTTAKERHRSSPIRGSIKEETDAELYSAITQSSGDSAQIEESQSGSREVFNDGTEPPTVDNYSYAVEMRRKVWKFQQKSASTAESDYDDTYAQINTVDRQSQENTNHSADKSHINNNHLSDSSVADEIPEYSSTVPREQSNVISKSAITEIPEYSAVVPKEQRNVVTSSPGKGDVTPQVDAGPAVYSSVVPRRLCDEADVEKPPAMKVSSMVEYSNPSREFDGDYVSLREVKSNPESRPRTDYTARNSQLNLPEIRSLPNERIEYTARSHFDDIRLFLSRNRGDNEVFRDPPSDQLGGNSIDALSVFLQSLSCSNQPENGDDDLEITRL